MHGLDLPPPDLRQSQAPEMGQDVVLQEQAAILDRTGSVPLGDHLGQPSFREVAERLGRGKICGPGAVAPLRRILSQIGRREQRLGLLARHIQRNLGA